MAEKAVQAEQSIKKENKMGTMPVNKLLLSMALPMIVSMLVQALYNIVDSIIMINCKKDTQIKRLENGDLGKEEIEKRIKMQLTNEQKIDKIKQLKKEFFIIDTSNNPKENEYEELLKKEGLYE